MKKKLLLVIAIVLCVTLVGCGKKEEVEETEKTIKYEYTSSSSVKEKVTVSFTFEKKDYKYSEKSEDLITETKHSKAGVILGNDFNIQIDYASYDKDQTWDSFKSNIKSTDSRYKSFTYNGVKGLRIYHSGVISYYFPSTTKTYLMFTILPSESYTESYKTLLDNEEIEKLFETLTIEVKEVK